MSNTALKKTGTNIKRQTNFAIFWTILVICYIFIEWVFNQHLMHVMSFAEISIEDFGTTVLIGKITLSIGISLIIKGLYRYTKWWELLVGTLIGFIVLSVLYMEAVESFPPELRYASHYGEIQRKNVVALKDEDQILNIKEDGWHTKPLLLSHYMFTLDNKNWLEFQNRVTEPVTREVSYFIKNKNKHFESYKMAEDARKELDNSWNVVLEAKSKYEAVRYGKSKRYEKKAALEAFRATTGIEPSTTKEEFYKENNKEYNRALAVRIFPGYPAAGVAPVYIRNFPQEMSKDKFFELIEKKSTEIKSKLTPSMKEIRNARNAPEIVKLVALPPIMIALSIISIVFNLLIVIGMWMRLLGKNSISSSQVIMPIYFAITLFVVSIVVIVKQPITKEYPYWDKAEQTLAVKYPGLAAFWKVGLKLESVLCITEKPPELATNLTKSIYGK